MDWSWFLHFLVAFVGGGATALVIIFAFSRWLGELWLGRLLEKEKAKYAEEMAKIKAGFDHELEHYRAQLDRSIFVTRAHFETEFTAMKATGFEPLPASDSSRWSESSQNLARDRSTTGSLVVICTRL